MAFAPFPELSTSDDSGTGCGGGGEPGGGGTEGVCVSGKGGKDGGREGGKEDKGGGTTGYKAALEFPVTEQVESLKQVQKELRQYHEIWQFSLLELVER
ncbi:hypothetical protein L6164_024587 [Bauhinia variegata]|uniref:Uncharacterized protein n=1 Tax=Bauhinia variegata TaxID=167791 RepID=A0ACB9LYA9_BAUVA|nr:hypothetical protein L6164_024587 [Bauhinia variegata]